MGEALLMNNPAIKNKYNVAVVDFVPAWGDLENNIFR